LWHSPPRMALQGRCPVSPLAIRRGRGKTPRSRSVLPFFQPLPS
jgi:hypothetical protein